jgi:hypothetical protein
LPIECPFFASLLLPFDGVEVGRARLHAAAQRGSWELRVFAGRDPLTGKPSYRTRTVVGPVRMALGRTSARIADRLQQGHVRRASILQPRRQSDQSDKAHRR